MQHPELSVRGLSAPAPGKRSTTSNGTLSAGEHDRDCPALVDGDLEACASSLASAVTGCMASDLADHGVTPLQFALLRVFLDGEEWTVTQLARVLPAHPSRISRVAGRLVDMGLMERRRPRRDRRVVLLTLTSEGRTVTAELDRLMRSYETRLSEGISDEEMAVLASAASRIAANYAALSRPSREYANGNHRSAQAQTSAAIHTE